MAASGGTDPAADRLGRMCLVVVCLATVAVCAPFLESVSWLGDEGIWLGGADRLLQGQRLYVDFFEFHPPGGFAIVEAWFRIAGTSLAAARILAILTIAGIAGLTYCACRDVSGRPVLSAALALGWVVASQAVWPPQINHHWFTTLVAMAAVRTILAVLRSEGDRPAGHALSGLMIGAGLMITPTRGLLMGLAALGLLLAFRRTPRALAAFAMAGAAVPVLAILYTIANGSLAEAFAQTIVWPATRYASIQGVPYGYGATGFDALAYLAPGALALAAVACQRSWPACRRDPTGWACLAFALVGFVGSYPRPDIAHIAFCAPLVLPLVAWSTDRLAARANLRLDWLPVGLVAAATAGPATALVQAIVETRRTPRVETARGAIAPIAQPGLPELLARLTEAPASARLFAYPYVPMLPFLLGRVQVSPHDVFVPHYTTASQYREACRAAFAQADLVVIETNWSNPDFLRRIFPAMTDPEVPEKAAFERALRQGFSLAGRYGPYEVRRRTTAAAAGACDGI